MNKRNTIIMIVLFFIGLLTLFYPTLSNYYNEKMGSKTIYNYENILNSYDIDKFKQIKKDAINYNKKLSKLKEPLLDYDDLKNYNKVLNVNNEGMIGYLSIDKIRVEIPIYHGTNNDTLNSFVGHVEGTSLPIGGKGTHSVLSAHRGLPSAKLFSDLDRLQLGDTFKITVLDEVLTYEVDKISIVKPNNSKELKIDKNNDIKLNQKQQSIIVKTLTSLYGLLPRSEEHTSELQSRGHLVCRLLLEKKKLQVSHLLLLQ